MEQMKMAWFYLLRGARSIGHALGAQTFKFLLSHLDPDVIDGLLWSEFEGGATFELLDKGEVVITSAENFVNGNGEKRVLH